MSQSDVTFTQTGPVSPSTQEVQAAVTEAWQAAFGNELNVDAATPQGQLITTQTAIIQDKNSQLVFLSQMFDPAVSDGIWQDALASIYFIERQAARPTVVECVCTGLEGVIIAGSDTSENPAQVKDEAGHVFVCQTTGTIPASGRIALSFAAQEPGPLVVAAHTVTRIVQAQPGWDTVDNPSAGATGRDVESRQEFEARRRDSVSLNSRSMLASVYAEVGNTAGVTDLLARQNRGDTPKTEGGVVFKPHSIFISVLGGEDAAIAQAIYNSVSGGCDYNGNTSYVYTDPVTGAVETVLFTRPEEVAFQVLVTIKKTPSLPNDIVARIQANVVADFYGEPYQNEDGTTHHTQDSRVRIGDGIYASRFVCPVISAGAANVVQVELTANGGAAGNFVQLQYDQYPSLTPQHVVVTIEEA